MTTHRCMECDLPDPYNGDGDGIGSCECSRCEECGWPPGTCNCHLYDLPDWPAWPPDVITIQPQGGLL